MTKYLKAEVMLGICLTVVLSVASLVLIWPSDATAEEPKLSKPLPVCSKAEVERRFREGSLLGTCGGSFDAATPEEVAQARDLEASPNGTAAIEKEPSASPDGLILFCGFKANGDYAHISSTGDAISAHGWWDMTLNFRCPSQSVVVTTLFGFWRESPTVGYFVEIGSDAQSLGPNNITGQNTTARRSCTQTSWVTYYSKVKVTLGDGSGRKDTKTTNEQDLFCYPI